MKDYFKYVEYLSENKIDETFFNAGPFHAAIVMSRIFKRSKDVKIFCGGFTGEVSADPIYLTELNNFLSKEENTLTVIVEDYTNNKNNKIYKLFHDFREKYKNVVIYETKIRVIKDDNGNNKPIHFAIGDDNKIRIETNTSDFTAEANFNSISSTAPFIELFNNLQTSISTKPVKGFEPISKASAKDNN